MPIESPARESSKQRNQSWRIVHLVCTICHPDLLPGVEAVCGTKIRGNPAKKEDVGCVVCEQVYFKHVKSHMFGHE